MINENLQIRSIVLDKQDLAELDKLAKTTERSRSFLIRQGIKKVLQENSVPVPTAHKEKQDVAS